MQHNNQTKIKTWSKRKLVDGIIYRSNLPKRVLAEESSYLRNKTIYFSLKIAGVVTLVFALFSGLSSIGSTVSYFSDIEVSTGNRLQAGVLGLNIFSIGDVIGRLSIAQIPSEEMEDEEVEEYEAPQENIGTADFNITVGESDGSLPSSYTVSGVLDPTNGVGCEQMDITATFNDFSYSGPFVLLSTPRIFEMGEWQFLVSLPPNTGLPPGALCRGEIVFHAGLAEVAQELMHTFSAEKKYQFEITNWGEVLEQKEVPVLETPDIPLGEVTPDEGGGDAPAPSVEETVEETVEEGSQDEDTTEIPEEVSEEEGEQEEVLDEPEEEASEEVEEAPEEREEEPETETAPEESSSTESSTE